MAEGMQEEMSWSGLGVGTDKESFLEKVRERLVPDIDPAEAAEAVFCVLTERLSGGTVNRLLEQLPPDVRELMSRCPRKKLQDDAKKLSRDDFYMAVAEHLLVDPEDVRRILHAVFGALHSQTTEKESERIASELPNDVSYTWVAARHDVPAPH